MTVYKRGDSWYIDIVIKGHRIHHKAGESRREAQEYEDNLKAKARQDKLRTKTVVGFAETAEKYLKHIKATLSSRTYELYYSDYHSHLKPVFELFFIQDLTNEDLRAYQAKKSLEDYAPRTVNIHMGLIRKIVNFSGIDIRLKYPMLREPKKLHAFLTPDEAMAIISLGPDSYKKSPQSPRTKKLVALALARIRFGMLTGLRPAELAYLAWTDIDESIRLLTVRSKPSEGWEIKTVEQRSVNLSTEALGILRGIHRESKWVFSDNGKPVKSIRRSISTAATLAGIQRHVTPNMLRHTFATLSLKAGANPRAIQAVMGHSSLSTTEKYLDAMESSKIEAMDLIGGMLKKKKRGK